MTLPTIGIITHSHPHLKTEQVVESFVRQGYTLRIYALPFKHRKPRSVLLHHRPDQSTGLHPEQLASKHQIEYIRCETDTDVDSLCDVYHVLVGSIISSDCIEGKKIINCHPGIIPAVRGLDAFKWCIYDQQPLGITLHYIDQEVDKGEIISIVPTSVYKTDSIESLARRHYENELDVTSNFERYLSHPVNEYASIPEGDQHMRMGREKEVELEDRFNQYLRHLS